jgi:hypothetical protein
MSSKEHSVRTDVDLETEEYGIGAVRQRQRVSEDISGFQLRRKRG